MNQTVTGLFTIGSALYGSPQPPAPPQPSPWPGPYPPRPPTACVECQRPAQLFDVDAGPWCSILCRVIGSCVYCGLPASDAEGHWCLTETGETWRLWSAS